MKIAFFGTSQFAIPALSALFQYGMAPDCVITASDKPKNRGRQLTASPIKQWLKIDKPGLSILEPNKIDAKTIVSIAAHKPDIGIVVAYGKILPKELINIFPKGILNIHPSLLPKYRGPSPIQATILNGDTETGVTIILIDEKMDFGPIVAQQKYDITSMSNITYQTLHDELANRGATLLVEMFSKWIEGKITPIPQDNTQATYTKLLKKEDGRIDWTKSAESIERLMRAYNPWPGTYTILQDGRRLKIKKTEIISRETDNHARGGTFFKTSDEFLAVSCGKYALKLLVVQPEGKKDMSGKAYLLGHKGLVKIL